MLFTALVGMLLASPGYLLWQTIAAGIAGIGLVASAAAALNQIADRHIDMIMQRTRARPLPARHLETKHALVFAVLIGGLGTFILLTRVNLLTTILTLLSLVGYSLVYTRYLKYATPQNIVIGGAAGATPPMLGWSTVTGQVGVESIVLFLIIFIWTPPHFWALALYRKDDYALARIPMLPITHGDDFTRSQILLYTLLLTAITMLPYLVGMSGTLYLFGAALLNGCFLYHAAALKIKRDHRWAKSTFAYSITYILAIFALLLLDAYLLAIGAQM